MVTTLSGMFFRPLPITTLTVRQFLDGKAVRIAGLIGLIPAVFALIYLISPGATRFEFFADTLFLNLFAPTVLPIATLILATSAFGNELEDRTLPYLTLKPVSRLRIVLEKWLGVVLVGIPVILFGQVVTAIILSFTDGNATEQRYAADPRFADRIPDFTSAIWPALAAGAVGVVMFASVFLLLSLYVQRALLAGIFYAFVWESLLGRYLSGIRLVSVKQYVQSIFTRLLDDPNITIKNPFQLDSALIVAAVTAVVCIALSTRRLRRINLE
jgi:ABC-2 type transport system permease protein